MAIHNLRYSLVCLVGEECPHLQEHTFTFNVMVYRSVYAASKWCSAHGFLFREPILLICKGNEPFYTILIGILFFFFFFNFVLFWAFPYNLWFEGTLFSHNIFLLLFLIKFILLSIIKNRTFPDKRKGKHICKEQQNVAMSVCQRG